MYACLFACSSSSLSSPSIVIDVIMSIRRLLEYPSLTAEQRSAFRSTLAQYYHHERTWMDAQLFAKVSKGMQRSLNRKTGDAGGGSGSGGPSDEASESKGGNAAAVEEAANEKSELKSNETKEPKVGGFRSFKKSTKASATKKSVKQATQVVPRQEEEVPSSAHEVTLLHAEVAALEFRRKVAQLNNEGENCWRRHYDALRTFASKPTAATERGTGGAAGLHPLKGETGGAREVRNIMNGSGGGVQDVGVGRQNRTADQRSVEQAGEALSNSEHGRGGSPSADRSLGGLLPKASIRTGSSNCADSDLLPKPHRQPGKEEVATGNVDANAHLTPYVARDPLNYFNNTHAGQCFLAALADAGGADTLGRWKGRSGASATSPTTPPHSKPKSVAAMIRDHLPKEVAKRERVQEEGAATHPAAAQTIQNHQTTTTTRGVGR
eukprot:GHVU01086824.1.p1 GENE.GHVU01086824.1~~GHVU01086824.1.p1  ORF type:complete len:437 (-),score=74.47 GHVU01086824.1:543-1853(-)